MRASSKWLQTYVTVSSISGDNTKVLRQFFQASFATLLGVTPALADAPDDCLEGRSKGRSSNVVIKACTELIAKSLVRRGKAYFWEYDDVSANADFMKANESAINDFSKAIEIDPQYGEAYGQRAFSYSVKHQNDLSIADYTSNSKSPSQLGPHSFFWPESR